GAGDRVAARAIRRGPAPASASAPDAGGDGRDRDRLAAAGAGSSGARGTWARREGGARAGGACSARAGGSGSARAVGRSRLDSARERAGGRRGAAGERALLSAGAG